MCVIAICRDRDLTVDEVTRMDAANPHGIGVAWASRDKERRPVVRFAKNLSVGETLALLPSLPKPYIVHFRFASVGGITPELCHPFPIHPAPSVALRGQTRRGVLFHNGTWSDWKTGFEVVKELGAIERDAKSEGWSDSRVMAALAAGFATHAVAEIIGKGQRIVVLRPDGGIERFGDWSTYAGIEVSNLWWTWTAPVETSRRVTAFDDLDLDDDDDTLRESCGVPTWLAGPAAVQSKKKPTAKVKPKGKKGKKKRARKPAPETSQISMLAADVGRREPGVLYPLRVPRPTWPAFQPRKRG